MAKYVLTATSRDGQSVNPVGGASTDSIAVYTDAELKQRLAAAKNDPRNLDITVRKA